MPLATEERLIAESENALAPNPAEGRTPQELADIVTRFAASDGWIDRVRLRTENRWYERLYLGTDYDIWAISWMPAQSTGFHDHGDSSGAFVVATGVLEEHRPGAAPIEITPGRPRAFGQHYAHDVRNASLGPAVSIHAYSPPLTEMNEYDLVGSELVSREQASARAESLAKERHQRKPPQSTRASNIDLMLAEARDRLRRLSPSAAFDAMAHSQAILVDIRPEVQRAQEGNIPGALIVERNVLEWRFDPKSEARLQIATSYDLQIIVFCSEGYTSSLAAAALQELGLWRATDIEGGFQGWLTAGLPTSQHIPHQP